MLWIPFILILPYFFLLLKIYSCLRKIKPYRASTSCTEKLTVVIACHNESDKITDLLHDISKQDYPGDFTEVIVVDDNSTDNTFEIASGFRGIKNLIIIKNSGKGKKSAITDGIIKATGNLIITTDADCRMGKSWITVISSFYTEYKPDMILCPVILESQPGFFGRFQELEFLSLQGVTAGTAACNMSIMCNGANLAFTRDTFLRNRKNLHYEIATGDDVFLLHSLKTEPGSKIMWLESQESMVHTTPAKTILSFLRQRRKWISKSGTYKDRFTIVLAIVTFVTILTEILTLFAGLFIYEFLWVYLVILLIKSLPDFLILQNTSRRYGKKDLMKWSLPSGIIYPFYVFAVLLFPSKLRNRAVD